MIYTISASISKFAKSAAFSGVLLIVVSAIALVWANGPYSQSYFDLWNTKITIGFGEAKLSKPLLLWINDGLMAMFFFVIGLEIKREIIAGELSTWKKAAMPVYAAIGGMVVPSLIFMLFNQGKPSANGWGIPMATDIAFSLGILALLGKRVPLSLKIFLTALAIVDDLGAVLVIAFFYSSEIILSNVGLGAIFLAVMMGMNIAGVRSKLAFAIPGILGIWLAFLLSGVHATIAGVLAAFAIPASMKIDRAGFKQALSSLANRISDKHDKANALLDKSELQVVTELKDKCKAYEPPLQSLENSMHGLVVFVIMPIFALSNTGVLIESGIMSSIANPAGLGIIIGLFVGKPLGIFLFSYLSNKLGLANMPEHINWNHILGVGLLAGIGFTMSLFVASLAYHDGELVNNAKISILIASVLAGVTGYLVLRMTLKK